MTLIRLRHQAASPLFRHPRLLIRKIRDRLAGPARFSFGVPPPNLRYSVLPNLATGLRQWRDVLDVKDEPWPHTRVFRKDFDARDLWDLCASGPRQASDLTGDVKLIWEFSRSHGVFTGALQGRNEYAFVDEWIRKNPNPDGPAWSCPMDVAIRAVNWIAADALLDGRLGASVGIDAWTSNLWNSGRLIFQRLETRLICSNHYLADLLGLLVIGAALNRAEWYAFALNEFPRALRNQTFADGGVYEASLPYHALVTEMALLFVLVSESTPAPLSNMCQVLADAMDVDGDVFQIGDNDSGRILPAEFVARCGRAQALLKLAEIVTQKTFRARADAQYPDSGWWIKRKGDWTVFLEFGGVGMAGLGGHAHNDDLSVCVNWRNHRVLVDPGSFLYSPAPDLRNSLRSVSAHNSLALDGEEPRPIPQNSRGDIFSLPGDACAWARQRVKHVRSLELKDDVVLIEDQLLGDGQHLVQWHWQLAPGVTPSLSGESAILAGAGWTCALRCRDTSISIGEHDTIYSPWYGESIPSKRLMGELRMTLPCSVKWELRAKETQDAS